MEMTDALELIKLRNNFYRDNYRRLALALLVCLLSILVLLGLVYAAYTAEPQPKYFATTDDGRILPLVPINQPYKTRAEVLQWATEAVVAANTYDFVNYRKQLQRASDYFTSTGWQSFMQALQFSNNLETIKVGKVMASARPVGAPQIAEEGLLGGAYYWKVTLPIEETYQGFSIQQKNHYLVTLTVIRVPTLSHPSGLGIQQMILELTKS